ncbi:MAG: hypothetical protein R2724_13485 [Bryobacterales bacterium]
MLYTRDEHLSERIPILGLAYPNLDNAAKITRLLANEGEHDGKAVAEQAQGCAKRSPDGLGGLRRV